MDALAKGQSKAGEASLAALTYHKDAFPAPDVVLSDVSSSGPGMSGHEIVRHRSPLSWLANLVATGRSGFVRGEGSIYGSE